MLDLRVPQDRAGELSTEIFERYQRSEKALTAALFEMYVQGVSTRKVKEITEELCGHGFSASTVSAIVRKLDDSLAEFARRRLEQPLPYLILDARYEKVREGGSASSQAVLFAVAVDWDGRRQIVVVEMANREVFPEAGWQRCYVHFMRDYRECRAWRGGFSIRRSSPLRTGRRR